MNEISLQDKIVLSMPEDRHKISMILTLIGCSAHILGWLNQHSLMSKMPMEVKYAATIITQNIRSLFSDHPAILDMQESFDPLILSEQQQERLYRELKLTITELYNSIQEDEI